MQLKTIGKGIFNLIKTICFIIIIAFVFEHLGYLGAGTLLLLVVLFFIYRIYINKNDMMYNLREQLEATLFYKPFRFYEKGEKIRMKKFVWRKSK